MVFGYYHRLGKKQKSIYRKSDSIENIVLNHPENIRQSISTLKTALASEDRNKTEKVSHTLVNEILYDLKVDTVKTKVLSARPSNDWGELHGLYEPVDGNTKARITVWMRTARHKKVVAFRTFLRTILHELCHHLDYELLELIIWIMNYWNCLTLFIRKVFSKGNRACSSSWSNRGRGQVLNLEIVGRPGTK